MTHWEPIISMLVYLGVFGSIFAAGMLIFVRAYGDRRRSIDRLREMADDSSQSSVGKESFGDALQSFLPSLAAKLFPDRESQLAPLKQQLLEAGYYQRQALGVFLVVKLILMLTLPLIAAVVPYLSGAISLNKALVISLAASAFGMIAPGIWLERQVKARHRILRHALPDALDMLVLCLEGGISMSSAFQRVTTDLQAVHPVLGYEMGIMQREIQLGLSAGEALKKMAERCGLTEVRDLANVMLQSERLGASMVKALRTHAETGRQDRQAQLEEAAQKTAVKILFPTLLCIFPAIFIVLLGPAAYQLATLFSR